MPIRGRPAIAASRNDPAGRGRGRCSGRAAWPRPHMPWRARPLPARIAAVRAGAAIADANVHPVPWVLRVWSRGVVNSENAWPSNSRFTTVGPSKWPPLITTAAAPRPCSTRAASRASSSVVTERPVSTSASRRFGVTTRASGRRLIDDVIDGIRRQEVMAALRDHHRIHDKRSHVPAPECVRDRGDDRGVREHPGLDGVERDV